MRRGGEVVREWLESAAVEHFFHVPGETFLPVLDALRDSTVTVVTCRHESGASFAAAAYAKYGRRLGVCMGTRGPGASNLAIGVHTAYYEAVPLVVLIGQVPRAVADSGAFQEVDMKLLYAPVAKRVLYVAHPDSLPDVLQQAAMEAETGRPGPVVVVVPQEVFDAQVTAPLPARVEVPRARGIDTQTLAQVTSAVTSAQRPLVLSSVYWSGDEQRELVRFVETAGLPVLNGWRYYASFPNEHANFCGNLGLGAPAAVDAALKDADFVLGLGPVLEDVNVGGGAKLSPYAAITVVSPWTDAGGLRRAGAARVQLISADPAALVKQLAAWADARGDAVLALRERLAERTRAMHTRVAGSAAAAEEPGADGAAKAEAGDGAGGTDVRSATAVTGGGADAQPRAGGADAVTAEQLFRTLETVIPKHAAVVSDAGNFAQWLLRHLTFGSRKFAGPINGAMGYGLPGGIGVKLADPARPVWVVAGDGGLLMTAGEMNTAVRLGLDLVCVVVNNALYGTIRAHQERHFPNRHVGTDLGDVDFAGVARALGWRAWTTARADELAPALAAVAAAPGCRLLDVRVAPEPLSAGE